MVDPSVQKAEYDRIANRLLNEGLLGHGLHEDLLVNSSHWFHQRIGPNSECLADFFGAALENHVVLVFALPEVSSSAEEAVDLFDFLHHLVSWIVQLPKALLLKSPEPLVLVVGHRGLSDQFGAHMMQRGGPSIIFWQTFYSVRKALRELSYARLSHQIGKTLVHELIGHQLAFCTLPGPIVSHKDISEILQIADIGFIKLNDGSSLSAPEFARSPDLLAAIRLTKYIQSARQAHRYFGNLTELIAFAVEGAGNNAPYNYEGILRVLRGSLLREPLPVNVAGDRSELYRSHDLSTMPFEHAYVYQTSAGWLQTEARSWNGQWLSLHDCEILCRSILAERASPACATKVPPDQSFTIQMPFDGIPLVVKDAAFMVSPFGLYSVEGDNLIRQPEHFQIGPCELQYRLEEGDNGVLILLNKDSDAMPVSYWRLNAATPSRN